MVRSRWPIMATKCRLPRPWCAGRFCRRAEFGRRARELLLGVALEKLWRDTWIEAMAVEKQTYCLMLRTKTGYFRSLQGQRLIDSDDSTACYSCLLTQRPFGPDGMPADPADCGHERACFRPDH